MSRVRATDGFVSIPAFVDIITQTDEAGRPHSYARNVQGLHVPIETLSLEDLRSALSAALNRSERLARFNG